LSCKFGSARDRKWEFHSLQGEIITSPFLKIIFRLIWDYTLRLFVSAKVIYQHPTKSSSARISWNKTGHLVLVNIQEILTNWSLFSLYLIPLNFAGRRFSKQIICFKNLIKSAVKKHAGKISEYETNLNSDFKVLTLYLQCLLVNWRNRFQLSDLEIYEILVRAVWKMCLVFISKPKCTLLDQGYSRSEEGERGKK